MKQQKSSKFVFSWQFSLFCFIRLFIYCGLNMLLRDLRQLRLGWLRGCEAARLRGCEAEKRVWTSFELSVQHQHQKTGSLNFGESGLKRLFHIATSLTLDLTYPNLTKSNITREGYGELLIQSPNAGRLQWWSWKNSNIFFQYKLVARQYCIGLINLFKLFTILCIRSVLSINIATIKFFS